MSTPLIGLTLMLASAAWASASPVELTITGTAFGSRVNYTTDVTHGFSGASISLGEVPASTLIGNNTPGSGQSFSQPINSSMTLFASVGPLGGGPGASATLDLNGPITGAVGQAAGNPNFDGGISGSAIASNFTLVAGTDPASVPAWFPTLSAQVSGTVRGTGDTGMLGSTLSINTGTVPAAQNIPEPSSIAAFAACAGYVVLALLRRRRGAPAATH